MSLVLVNISLQARKRCMLYACQQEQGEDYKECTPVKSAFISRCVWILSKLENEKKSASHGWRTTKTFDLNDKICCWTNFKNINRQYVLSGVSYTSCLELRKIEKAKIIDTDLFSVPKLHLAAPRTSFLLFSCAHWSTFGKLCNLSL